MKVTSFPEVEGLSELVVGEKISQSDWWKIQKHLKENGYEVKGMSAKRKASPSFPVGVVIKIHAHDDGDLMGSDVILYLEDIGDSVLGEV